MRHIGIDARLLFQTGVGTYLQNLLHFIPTVIPKDITLTLYCLKSDAPFLQKEVPMARIHTTDALWHSWKEQSSFLSLINSDHLDLMHFTYFGHPVLYKRKFVSTIHDVTPLLFKTGRASTKNPLLYLAKHAAFSYVLKNQINNSRAIITPTHTVKEQLALLYGDSVNNKTTPIYEGVSYRLISSTPTKDTVGRPYFLYVGNFYPHKNVEFMIRALLKSNNECVLVLAGPDDYFLKRLLGSLSEREKNHILIKDKQSLNELAGLYTHARALIHPSVSEGFGLPIAEAMYFNIPIIASHIPVFQELLGTSYYSFDPFEESSLVRAIQKFSGEKEKKRKPVNREFSFEDMTRKTMDLYLKHV